MKDQHTRIAGAELIAAERRRQIADVIARMHRAVSASHEKEAAPTEAQIHAAAGGGNAENSDDCAIVSASSSGITRVPQ